MRETRRSDIHRHYNALYQPSYRSRRFTPYCNVNLVVPYRKLNARPTLFACRSWLFSPPLPSFSSNFLGTSSPPQAASRFRSHVFVQPRRAASHWPAARHLPILPQAPSWVSECERVACAIDTAATRRVAFALISRQATKSAAIDALLLRASVGKI